MTGKIEILTYKDPNDLEKREFYKDICKHPNLCASETLKLGLTNHKKRFNYGYIYTIDNLVNEIYTEWLDPVNQIKQMNSLTKSINKIENSNLKKSFKFNKSEILKSLRFLIEMGVNPESINAKDEIIKQFKKIYTDLREEYEWKALEKTEEINLEKIKEYFEKMLKKEKLDHKKDKASLNINDKNIKNSDFSKIVINGLHRFTPIIFRMIDDLMEANISIVFVINFLDEYPELYNTWEKVYSWTGVAIKASNEELVNRNNLGRSLGELLNGNVEEFKGRNIEFIKYDNISSFADKVSSSYKATINMDNSKDKLKAVGNISKMNEQFYSSKMEDINNLLKQYHPSQFGDKHFLAYPIGQFILSIYNMWNVDEKKLLLDSKNLKQCIALGLFNTEKYNCLDIYNKLESYYKSLKIAEKNSATDFKNEIEKLKDMIGKLNEKEKKKNKDSTLRMFSFYNIKILELKHFIKIIEIIESISNEIFKDSNDNINFYKHYQKLIYVIQSKIDEENITKKEKSMLIELDDRLKKLKDLEVEGDIDNVRESLHFYLNRIEEIEANEHQASWIVRNLEHLDGGVLLEDKRDKTYHLCLIGDMDMNAPIKDMLSFPLTLNFFEELKPSKDRYLNIIESYKERSNFLRYCLFYGAFFLKSKIKVSYIKNYKDDINQPYYLLKMMGIKFEDEAQDLLISNSETVNKGRDLFYGSSFKKPIEKNEIRNFLYCEYKYFLEDVLERDTFFYSEFTQRKYYETLLFYESVKRIRNSERNSISEIVKNQNQKFKDNFFYIWKESIFKDAYKKVVKTIESVNDIDDIKNKKIFDDKYFDIRKKFIFAKLTDEEEKKSNVIANLHGIDEKKSMIYKRQISQKLMESSPLNTANSLEKCKYCGLSEICLERYRSL